MDPISLAGLGFGAVSLTFQLFSGCVKGYNLLSDANGVPAQLQYLRVRLKIEQSRLLNWAEVANLSEQNKSLCTTVQKNEALVQEILREKDKILAGFWKVQNSYQSLIVEEGPINSFAPGQLHQRFPHTTHSLESRAMRFIERLRRYPTNLRWATFDRERFEGLLSQLSALNDFMKTLLDSDRQKSLYQTQSRMSMQVLQLNNKVDHLLQIFQASNFHNLTLDHEFSERLDRLRTAADPPPYRIVGIEDGPRLATFARFKALNLAMNQDPGHADIETVLGSSGDRRKKDTKLDPTSFAILRSRPPVYSDEIERSEGLHNGNEPIWIEWKYYDPLFENGKPDPSVEQRLSKLTALLSDPHKPSEFHTPRCAGYFNDWNRGRENRFGVVFQRPPGISTANAITSLFDLLLEEEMPSLTSRLGLATTLVTAIANLHATDWLHKALRSHNIVFFNEPGNPDLSNPYLSGFGLSRPAQQQEMTERPDSNPLYNLYRHPLAHGDAATEGIGGFKKLLDIYSLGVVLMEIALWKPFHQVLGIQSVEDGRSFFKPGVTKRIKTQLINDGRYLRMVKAAAGDTFAGVVRTCLAGDFGVSLEDETSQGLVLQEAFYERVIMQLKVIVT